MFKDSTRIFDVFFSLAGIIIFLPFAIIIALLVKINSKGPAFFLQKRVGKNNKDFVLIKFRTMNINAEKDNIITIGNDKRITGAGKFLRKYKLDELPQLWNVLKGEMSIVGPRPELRKYVNLYTETQKEVLKIRPGITDFASIKFNNESELLALENDPERFYIDKIIPIKIQLNQRYIRNKNWRLYFLVIFKTLFSARQKTTEITASV